MSDDKCARCGKHRAAHEDGFAGPGCPSGGGVFVPMSDNKLQRLAQAIVSRLDAEHAERSPKRQEQDVNRVLAALRDTAAAERERIAKFFESTKGKRQLALCGRSFARVIRAMGDEKP